MEIGNSLVFNDLQTKFDLSHEKIQNLCNQNLRDLFCSAINFNRRYSQTQESHKQDNGCKHLFKKSFIAQKYRACVL